MINVFDVQRGYDEWAAKPHNAKWVRKLDGTPIANDITMTIWNTLRDIIEERSSPAPQPLSVLRAAIHEAVDLLMERTHGSAARSPAHNARLRLEAALAATEGSADV